LRKLRERLMVSRLCEEQKEMILHILISLYLILPYIRVPYIHVPLCPE